MTRLGRQMFGVGFVAFGLLQLLYGDMVPGRPPAWPPAFPGQPIAVYGSALCFVLSGVAIVAGYRVRQAGFLILALVFASAVVRNLPPALGDSNFGGAWTRLGKALALCGGALAIAGSASVGWMDVDRRFNVLAAIGGVAFGSFLIASGVQHFLFIDGVMMLVPAWIPGARAWAYLAGVALIAGGIGLNIPKTTRVAGLALGAMLLSWVLVLHIPRAVMAAAAEQRNEWTAVFEALAFAGIAWVVAAKGRA